MRILAVRGQNLASLSEFQIDLTLPPFVGTGLFAITGDTGAGKSTILDALCLGLYGAYPRAATEGREKVFDPGNEEIQAGDPRNILRRGAGDGFAQVDFVGQDGIEYRATWAVRRAKGKASGRLQGVERRLDRRDGSANVASGIEELKKIIPEKTGLTYDQFRRTVLLAQGEFDTFLLASDKERADLLEKITGTGIYTRISRQVHAGKDERERLFRERLSASAAMETLSDEDRERMFAEVAEMGRSLEALDEAIGAVTKKRTRGELVASAQGSLAKAEVGLAEAEERWQSAADKRDQLAALQAVEPLRSKREALSRANDARKRAEEALGSACEAKFRAVENYAALEAAATAARGTAEAARSEVQRFDPLWIEAASLDTQIATAIKERKAADRALVEARKHLTEVEAAHHRQAAAREDLQQKRVNAEIAIAPRADHETLYVSRERIAELFAEHARLATDEASARDQHDETRDALEAEVARRQSGALEIETADREIEQLEKARIEKAAALEAIPVEVAEARGEALSVLERVLHRAQEAARKRDGALADQAAVVAVREAALAARAEAETQLAVQQRRNEEARLKREGIAQLVDLAEATASQRAQALRADLVVDEPCPVCGATDHPFASEASGAEELVAAVHRQRADLNAVLATTQREIRGAEAEQARANAQLQAADTGNLQAMRRFDEAVADLARLLPEMAHHAGPAQIEIDALTGTAGPDAPVETFSGAIAAVEAALAQTTRLRQSADELRKVCDGLDKQIRDLAAKTKSARASVQEADVNLSELRVKSAALEASKRALEKQLEAARAALAPFLVAAGITVNDLTHDSSSALRRIEKLADDYARLVRERDELANAIATADDGLRVAVSTLENAKSEEARCADQLANRGNQLQTLETSRSALLGGEPTAQHKGRFEAARAEADKAQSDAVEKLQAAELENVKCGEAVDNASAKRSETELAVTDANEAFMAALRETGFEEAAARDFLAVPADTRASLTQQVGALETARRDATTTLETWRAYLEGLEPVEGEGAPEAIAELRQEFERLSGEKDALHGSLGAARDRLAQDDDRKKQLADVLHEIEALKTDLSSWQAVHDAIGSSDGAKFRSYVQGITLRHLVGLANHQLALLNPRYQLRQAGTSPLALEVIDREMGDEIRAPRSLSGGERFLVSLALALALSGLEGRQSFVDTLFIDEGFGSLDRDTLDVAIDALESLQGQGRKVGLITHVQAMIERIAVQVRVEKRGGGRSVIRVSNSTTEQNDSLGPLAHIADGAVA